MATGSRSRIVASAPDPSEPEPEPYLLVNRQRKHRVNRVRIVAFLQRLTRELAPGKPFSVVLVSDLVIEKYNRDYRGVNKPTDVLSFASEDDYLGDILISVETASDQADRSPTLSRDKNVERLTLHGVLHLMGYDHETDDGEMRALELRLRRRFRC